MTGVNEAVVEQVACKAVGEATFAGAVARCCFGKDGEMACQCDPIEKTVRGIAAGRAVRRLTAAERQAMEAEADTAGLGEVAGGMSDRDLAVTLAAVWDSRPED